MLVDRERVARALPGYTLGVELGAGSFGLVLAGEHRRMGRPVAVKVMRADGPEGRAVAFAAEARTLAGLDHPHIVRVYDYLDVDGLCLVVMELLPGGTLTHRRADLTPPQACAAGLAVAAALDHAHSHGVLHRDIKTDNILFAADGTVKVTDFGLAKIFEGSAATASGLAGTPLYMAPEQIDGGRLGFTTDLYALGIVLYQLLAGRPPFDPRQPVQVLWRQHLTEPPPPLTGVPERLARVVLRALEKNPADRHPDAATFAADLAHAATGIYGPGWASTTGLPLHLTDQLRPSLQTPQPADASPRKPDPRPMSAPPTRRRFLTAGAAFALAAAATLTAVVTTTRDGASPSTLTPTPTPTANPGPTPTPRPAVVDWSHPSALGPPLTAHTNQVWSVAFSPDGRTLATGAADKTVRLWRVTDPARPTPLGPPLTGHTGWVWSVAFSPDGRTLATTADDGTVRLWEVTDPARPTPLGEPLTAHTGGVLSAAFSPDGRTLATGAADKTVRLWRVTDPARPTPLGPPLTGHTDPVRSVAFSPDGRTLATTADDETVRLWEVTDPARPTPLGEPLTAHTGGVVSAAFSPDGRTLATSSKDGVRLWTVTDPARPVPLGPPLTGHTGWVWPVAFSPDGRTLATGAVDETVRLWEVTDPARPAPLGPPLTGHTDPVRSVAFSPDGRTLATTADDETVRLWEAG